MYPRGKRGKKTKEHAAAAADSSVCVRRRAGEPVNKYFMFSGGPCVPRASERAGEGAAIALIDGNFPIRASNIPSLSSVRSAVVRKESRRGAEQAGKEGGCDRKFGQRFCGGQYGQYDVE